MEVSKFKYSATLASSTVSGLPIGSVMFSVRKPYISSSTFSLKSRLISDIPISI